MRASHCKRYVFSCCTGNMQAAAAHPPTLLVGYDSEEDEGTEVATTPGATTRAGGSPALVLSVAEKGAPNGRAAVDLWTYAVRITPEDLAEEAMPYQGNTDSAATMASSHGHSSTGGGGDGAKSRLERTAGPVLDLKSTAATAVLGDLLSPTLCASPSPVADKQQQEGSSGAGWLVSTWLHDLASQQEQQLQLHVSQQCTQHHLPMHNHEHHQQQQQQQQQAKQAAEGPCAQAGEGEGSSMAASLCKPRHALSPGLQAVLAELLRSSTSADLAAAQQHVRGVEQQRQLRWLERNLRRSQGLQNHDNHHLQDHLQQHQGQQQHEQGRTSVGFKRARRLSDEFAARSDTIPSDARPLQQQEQQQQQQQQGHKAGFDGVSPRSTPLHAYAQAHSQQLQQQWQQEQMLRHWRIHHL
ncbi:hypothetical protein DUNSADRAFT_6711 [Dunaliella salina]|uniref:Uncharacterized protein n=1 Tax=Dunaliella salina TaxID=3046 RepID=A0ABQ7GMR4_DUNSA|nr:hypothetical protein DUNSADRAFT_6711 [Dunaliella salina]|eukprot:KAF5835899.1 hypothetical protein DUNSADRAFT_6711 [Dunaliella salina]